MTNEPKVLSDRELEVLQLLYQGATLMKVADLLGLSYSTIKQYVNRTYNKLGVRSRNEAFEAAMARGLEL